MLHLNEHLISWIKLTKFTKTGMQRILAKPKYTIELQYLETRYCMGGGNGCFASVSVDFAKEAVDFVLSSGLFRILACF